MIHVIESKLTRGWLNNKQTNYQAKYMFIWGFLVFCNFVFLPVLSKRLGLGETQIEEIWYVDFK